MNLPSHYHVSWHSIPAARLREWGTLQPRRTLWALLCVWASIFALVKIYLYALPEAFQLWGYLPVGFLIAGRQGALLQLAHEAAHHLVSPQRKLNDRIASWFCTLPLGFSFTGYAKTHLNHHSGVGTQNDPPSDSEKYSVVDTSDVKLYLLFLRDLCGISALKVFLSYTEPTGSKAESTSLIGRLLPLAVAQGIVFIALFQANPFAYITLWAIPAACFHMFLMRIRGMAEHGLARQSGITPATAQAGGFYTRSFLTSKNSYRFFGFVFLEKAFIGSLSVHYHHEHHLLPFVPYYHLAKVHAFVANSVNELNPSVYAPGYFAAALRSAKHTPAQEQKSRGSKA